MGLCYLPLLISTHTRNQVLFVTCSYLVLFVYVSSKYSMPFSAQHLSFTLFNNDRNGQDPLAPGSHFYVSLPYSLALSSGSYSGPVLWFTTSPAADRAGQTELGAANREGVHCSPFSTVSLYLWYFQHDQGHGLTPGRVHISPRHTHGWLPFPRQRAPSVVVAVPETIAVLPIILKESAGLKLGWMGLYHRIARNSGPWGVNNGYIWGSEGAAGGLTH